MSTVYLHGNIDVRHALHIRDLLVAELRRGEGVIADLAGVDAVDSAGLAGLVQVMSAAQARGQHFALSHMNEQVRRMVELSHLDRVLPTHESPTMRAPDRPV